MLPKIYSMYLSDTEEFLLGIISTLPETVLGGQQVLSTEFAHVTWLE